MRNNIAEAIASKNEVITAQGTSLDTVLTALEGKAAGSGSDISLGITSAAVGQTIKVKAVNEQGMPTAWEAADMASGEEQWELNATYKYSDLQFPAAFDLSGAKEWIIVFSGFYADVNTKIGVKFGISITYGNIIYFTFPIGRHSYGNAGIIH